MKVCTKCGELKSLDDFYKKRSVKCGVESRCKKCQVGRKRGATRERGLMWKYGIDVATYDSLHEKQGGVCASCGLPETRKNTKYLAVDHNHETGEVRGLLCQKCNTALGLLGDDYDKVIALAQYIKSTS